MKEINHGWRQFYYPDPKPSRFPLDLFGHAVTQSPAEIANYLHGFLRMLDCLDPEEAKRTIHAEGIDTLIGPESGKDEWS